MESLSLSGLPGWDFREWPRGRFRKATVPGCVHRDLHAHGLIPDPLRAAESKWAWVGERDWEYRLEFEMPATLLAHAHVELVAEGLDTVAAITINSRVLAATDNMFREWRFPARQLLRIGPNQLSIVFRSAERWVRTHRRSHRPKEVMDPVGGATRLRKQQSQFGWDWAPRAVTAGIWQDLRIEGWSVARLDSVRIRQEHHRNRVVLRCEPEWAGRRPVKVEVEGLVSFQGRTVAEVQDGSVEIAAPERWWPNGAGQQPLYGLELQVRGASRVLGHWKAQIGLRTVRLRRDRDRWGESFRFEVNNRPIFAKGASWIPAHLFAGGLRRADWEALVRSAAAANFNMLRVWGGGVYEQEAFYDLCDELGLLVWQDFMFACTLYPGDRAFRANVATEARQQVRRLRHHACLALWCGNNEIEAHNAPALRRPAVRTGYDAIFRRLLPRIVAQEDGITAYWRSSPARSDHPEYSDPTQSGSVHYWQVWHGGHPAEAATGQVFRFVAEFGMQSLPARSAWAQWCPVDQDFAFSPELERRQKSPGGNGRLLDYVARRHRIDRDLEQLTHASQLNQAHCLKVMVEHCRRHQGRCGGTLYWQLNDCWPGISWSSLEFGGAWKAAHYAVRRLYAPVLVCAVLVGTNRADIWTIHDGPETTMALLEWRLLTATGEILRSGHQSTRLRSGRSVRRVSLDCAEALDRHGRERVLLHVRLNAGPHGRSEDTMLFVPPKDFEVARAPICLRIGRHGPREIKMVLTSRSFQPGVAIDPGLSGATVDENFIDLLPGEARTIRVRLAEPCSVAELRKAVHVRVLAEGGQ